MIPEAVQDALERLAAAQIQILPVDQLAHHLVLERDGFASLVERTEEGFGAIGAAGLLTESGFAALVWRGEDAFFVAKGFERPAAPEQVDALRRFARDLEHALRRK